MNKIIKKGGCLMLKLTFDTEKCKGCNLCVAACPKKILFLSEKLNKAGMHIVECKEEEHCIGCKSCGIVCPDGVIVIEKF